MKSSPLPHATGVKKPRKLSNVSSKSRRQSLEKIKQERSGKRKSSIKSALSSSQVISAFASSSPDLFADFALLNVIVPMGMDMDRSEYQRYNSEHGPFSEAR